METGSDSTFKRVSLPHITSLGSRHALGRGFCSASSCKNVIGNMNHIIHHDFRLCRTTASDDASTCSQPQNSMVNHARFRSKSVDVDSTTQSFCHLCLQRNSGLARSCQRSNDLVAHTYVLRQLSMVGTLSADIRSTRQAC
jgi:hypothetical protein